MRVSKVLMTGFVVVMIAALTFTAAGAQAEPPPVEDTAAQDGLIGVDAAVVPVSPVDGVVFGRKPVFVFRRNFDAKAYQIQVREKGSVTELYTYSAAYTCNNYVCWMQPDTKLNMAGAMYDGLYEWRVNYRTGTLWHVYSAWKTFMVLDNGFNSTFDLNYKNWNIRYGPWMWDAVKGRMWTNGEDGKYNSMYFSYYFPTFDYTVRMKQKINDSNTNSLIVWGSSTATTTHIWSDAYYINYDNYKNITIWRTEGGSGTVLALINHFDAINAFGWNEIRVVGIYPYLDVWVNGVYLGYVTAPELPESYYLGFDVYNIGTEDQKFLVDWAKASIPSMSPFAVRDPAMELTMDPVE